MNLHGLESGCTCYNHTNKKNLTFHLPIYQGVIVNSHCDSFFWLNGSTDILEWCDFLSKSFSVKTWRNCSYGPQEGLRENPYGCMKLFHECFSPNEDNLLPSLIPVESWRSKYYKLAPSIVCMVAWDPPLHIWVNFEMILVSMVNTFISTPITAKVNQCEWRLLSKILTMWAS